MSSRFTSVPLSASSSADGKHLVGFYALLAAAKGPDPKGKPRRGSLIYKHQTDGGARFPPIEDGHIADQVKKTKLIAPEHVPGAIKAALQAADALQLFEDTQHSESLADLMVSAGLTKDDALEKIEASTEPLRSHYVEKVAMRQELARMLHMDAVKMRCERVHGKWIFSRHDALALTLDEGSEGQARKIWERMLEEYPELNSSADVTSSHNCRAFQFQGERERETPVADIKGIVEMLLLVPGQRAAKFRKSVVDVFVRFVGGDETLVEKIRGFAHVQRFLQANDPNHPATAFGDYVERRQAEEGASEEERKAKIEQALAHNQRVLDLEYEQRVVELNAKKRLLERENARAVEEDEAARKMRIIEQQQAATAQQQAAAAQHEAWRRDRALTITANAEALKVVTGRDLSPRLRRSAEDQLRTGILGQERVDAELGRPVYLSRILETKMHLKNWAAVERAKVFGKKVKSAVQRMFPDYAIETTDRVLNGQARDPNLYYEAHMPAILEALGTYRSEMKPVIDDELTAEGLQQRRRSAPSYIASFFAQRAPAQAQ